MEQLGLSEFLICFFEKWMGIECVILSNMVSSCGPPAFGVTSDIC